MSDITTITDGDQVIAVVIPHDLPAEGVRFITPQSYPFQVGLLGHKAGTVLKAHGHKKLKIETDVFQEILIIQTGTVAVDLYGLKLQPLCSVELRAGDSILFVDGGHGVRMLSDARILEVKQGPYPGDKLAKVFLPS
jgi:hypothetical protein